MSNLEDAWKDAGNDSGGETNETHYNTFTQSEEIPKRIDYILYRFRIQPMQQNDPQIEHQALWFRSGPGHVARVMNCHLPLPTLVPNCNFSYSDHEGVTATIRLQKSFKNPLNQVEISPYMCKLFTYVFNFIRQAQSSDTFPPWRTMRTARVLWKTP